jgi:hypothetical protein
MPEIHFRSIEPPPNKGDVTNRFGEGDFTLAVCVCFLRKCGRLEVIRDFRSLKNGGIPFPIKSDVAVHFLVGRLLIHLAGMFHLSGSVQKLHKNFMLLQQLRNIFQFLGASMTPKIFFANPDSPKRHFLEKICVDRGIMV